MCVTSVCLDCVWSIHICGLYMKYQWIIYELCILKCGSIGLPYKEEVGWEEVDRTVGKWQIVSALVWLSTPHNQPLWLVTILWGKERSERRERVKGGAERREEREGRRGREWKEGRRGRVWMDESERREERKRVKGQRERRKEREWMKGWRETGGERVKGGYSEGRREEWEKGEH
jgi:hypothetical protein